MRHRIRKLRKAWRARQRDTTFRLRTRLDNLLAPTRPEIGGDRAPLAVFLISFNRGDVLENTIRALGQQTRSTEIIINDFGSDAPETLQVLDALEARGITVYRRDKITSADDLNSVDDVVRDYMKKAGSERQYAVSDCDIDFATSSPDSLDIYEALLDRFRGVDCVGPMLRISDIPRAYPLFERVMNRHIDQFWKKRPIWVRARSEPVPCLPAPFDTTFAIHRAGSRFRRFKKGLRTYAPYDAKHIDWYLTEDAYWKSEYFKSSSAAISHWNNRDADEAARRDTLEFKGFYDVTWSSGTGRTLWRPIP